MKKKIDLIIVLNVSKEPNLKKFIFEVLKFLKEFDYKIFLVFDNKLDIKTFKQAKKLSNTNIIVLKFDTKNLVMTHKEAFKFVNKYNFKWFLSLATGYRHQPSDLPDFLKFIKNNKINCVWGYRDGFSYKAPLKRKIITFMSNFLSINLLSIDIPDPSSGFFMIHKRAISLINKKRFLSISHFFETELKFYLKNEKYKLVKINYQTSIEKIMFLNILNSIYVLTILFFKKLFQKINK